MLLTESEYWAWLDQCRKREVNMSEQEKITSIPKPALPSPSEMRRQIEKMEDARADAKKIAEINQGSRPKRRQPKKQVETPTTEAPYRAYGDGDRAPGAHLRPLTHRPFVGLDGMVIRAYSEGRWT